MTEYHDKRTGKRIIGIGEKTKKQKKSDARVDAYVAAQPPGSEARSTTVYMGNKADIGFPIKCYHCGIEGRALEAPEAGKVMICPKCVKKLMK